MHVCMYVNMCMYIHMLCIYIYIYIYIYTLTTHTHTYSYTQIGRLLCQLAENDGPVEDRAAVHSLKS